MNNLGIALGAYTQEMNRQREQQRADAADQRQQQQFDLQMQEAERVKGIRSQRESEVQRLKQIRGALANPNDPTNWTVLQQAAKDYGVGNIERMGNSVGVFAGGEQGVPQFKPLDLGAYSNAVMERLAFADADQAMPYLQNQANYAKDERRWQAGQTLEQQKLGLQRDELGVKRDYYTGSLENDRIKSLAYARGIAAQGGGGRGDAGGASGLTPEEQTHLNRAWEGYQLAMASGDGTAIARAAQNLEMLRSTFAVQRGKFPSIGGNNTRTPADPEATKAFYDFVKNNPDATDQVLRSVKKNLGLPVEPTKLDLLLENERNGQRPAAGLSLAPAPRQSGGHFTAPQNPYAGRAEAAAALRQFNSDRAVDLSSMNPVVRTRALLERDALARELGLVAPADYGKRPDGSKKGRGYFGEIKRPDGAVSTELSVSVEFDGKEQEIPLLVPTLSRSEIDRLIGGERPDDGMVR